MLTAVASVGSEAAALAAVVAGAIAGTTWDGTCVMIWAAVSTATSQTRDCPIPTFAPSLNSPALCSLVAHAGRAGLYAGNRKPG